MSGGICQDPVQLDLLNADRVAGTVSVGRLPPVQNVAGTVAISNLPQAARPIHSKGYTTSRFHNATALAFLNRAFRAEVPGTRICTTDEFNFALPTRKVQAFDPCVLFAGLTGIDSVVADPRDLHEYAARHPEYPHDQIN